MCARCSPPSPRPARSCSPPRRRRRRRGWIPTIRPARAAQLVDLSRRCASPSRQMNGRQVLLAEGHDRRRSDPAAAGGAARPSRATRSGCARPAATPGSATRPAASSARAACRPAFPAGWACFSACNFMFMGGIARYVDPGGLFIVHMFTHTGDRAGDPRRGRARRGEYDRPDRRDRAAIGSARQRGQRLPDPHGRLARAAHRGHVPADARSPTRNDRSTRRCLTQAGSAPLQRRQRRLTGTDRRVPASRDPFAYAARVVTRDIRPPTAGGSGMADGHAARSGIRISRRPARSSGPGPGIITPRSGSA